MSIQGPHARDWRGSLDRHAAKARLATTARGDHSMSDPFNDSG
jgi:hypothetical protein